MQSLLSTIHHSLSQSRAAFALRVFVSYDASGRRKDSLVVDIEQPRPHAPHTPLHTIRILTPAAPLPLTPSTTSRPLVPATSSVPSSAPHLPSSLATSSVSRIAASPSVPVTHSTPSHKRARSPSAPASPPRPSPRSTDLSSSSSSALPSPSPFCPPPTSAAVGTPLVSSTAPCPQSGTDSSLPLPPCGIEDAVDAEMCGAGPADGQCAVEAPPLNESSTALTSGPSLVTDLGQSAALDKRRQKAKEKKQRQKERRREEVRRRTDEAAQEMEDDTESAQRGDLSNRELRRRLAEAQEMLEDAYSEDGWAEELEYSKYGGVHGIGGSAGSWY